MKIFLIIMGVALISMFIVQRFQNPKLEMKPNAKLQTIQVGPATLSVEVANTPETITLGLGERDILGSDGMLFVMPARSIPTFWMKGMRFDLDFVWIDGDTVVDITENVKAEQGVPLDQLKTYVPQKEVTHVLELNTGEVSKRGIKVGDGVKLSY